jgi:hypothetical protein
MRRRRDINGLIKLLERVQEEMTLSPSQPEPTPELIKKMRETTQALITTSIGETK